DQLIAKTKYQLYIKERKQTQLIQKLEKHHPAEFLTLTSQKLSFLETKLNNIVRESIQKKKHSLALSIEKLSLLNPLDIMKRGYTITYDKNDEVIKSASHLNENDFVKIKLYDGEASCEVKEVKKKDYE